MRRTLGEIKLPSNIKAKIVHYWSQIVDSDIVRISHLINCNGDSITIGCCRTDAMELKYLSYKILESVNQFIGHKKFVRIKILTTDN